jgi:hypothetical protein
MACQIAVLLDGATKQEHVMGRGVDLLISGPIACEKRRTCEVTTKDPNLMTSVVSGMAGVSDCCPFLAQRRHLHRTLDHVGRRKGLLPRATIATTCSMNDLWQAGAASVSVDVPSGSSLGASMHSV